MNAHTPGPWWLDDDGFIASGSGDDYITVSDPHCSDRDLIEREANARLIAAAPALLAALQEMLKYAEGFEDADHVIDARAAIAAATGSDE